MWEDKYRHVEFIQDYKGLIEKRLNEIGLIQLTEIPLIFFLFLFHKWIGVNEKESSIIEREKLFDFFRDYKIPFYELKSVSGRPIFFFSPFGNPDLFREIAYNYLLKEAESSKIWITCGEVNQFSKEYIDKLIKLLDGRKVKIMVLQNYFYSINKLGQDKTFIYDFNISTKEKEELFESEENSETNGIISNKDVSFLSNLYKNMVQKLEKLIEDLENNIYEKIDIEIKREIGGYVKKRELEKI